VGDLTKDFARAEFACQCGCGFDQVSLVLVEALQKLRDEIGQPVAVISGCRCERHNADVGGAKLSLHLVGKAADVRVPGMMAREIYRAAAGITAIRGLGVSDERNFVHLDVRAQCAHWCYQEGREVAWHEAAVAGDSARG
jgi:uncharacterized protein YcbK (DUF882 family)